MGTRKGGKLSITTDGDQSTIDIVGTDQDILFNWIALTHSIVSSLHIPVELLTLSLPTMMARYEKEDLREAVLMDMSRTQKDAGETS